MLAVALGYAISWSIVGSVTEISAGWPGSQLVDFTQRATVVNRDELGTLADNVNHMCAELGRLYRQIEEASKHKSQSLANMSHELRTPLDAILGYSELILDNIYGEIPEAVRGVLDRVQSNGRHLLGLINDALDLAKIEAGQLTLSLADYSFQGVIETVFGAVESLATEKQLALNVEIPYGQKIQTLVESGHCLGRRVALRVTLRRRGVVVTWRRGFMEWTRILAYITGSVD
jgi:signal transduction histidine kinase